MGGSVLLRPSRYCKFSAFHMVCAALVVSNGLWLHDLMSNQAAGYYPIEADSISLPLAQASVGSLCVLFVMALALWLPRSHVVWQFIRATLAGTAVTLSSLLAAWTHAPSLQLAPVGFAALAGVCFWAWWQNRVAQ